MVLDVASGYGKWLFNYTRNYDVHIDSRPTTVAVDRYVKYLDDQRGWNKHLVRADASYLPFRPSSFDLAFFCEAIEHLELKAGKLAYTEVKRVSRFHVVTTPAKFYNSIEHDNSPLMLHKSYWSRKDLEELGLIVKRTGSFWIASNIQTPSRSHLILRKMIPLKIRELLGRGETGVGKA